MLEGLLIGIDHVGVCVSQMDPAAELWSALLTLPIAHRECVDPQRTEAAFVDPPGGGTSLELISPMSGNVGLERFLQKRGPGLHHVAFAVTDIAESLARLKQAGVALIDEEPRAGARGHLVAFLHPRAAGGVLVELVQRSKGHA